MTELMYIEARSHVTPLKHRVWFVRAAPAKSIQLHPTLRLDLRDGEEWFENLIKDIATNGLDNPVLVHNQTMPCDEMTRNRIVHGCNRYRAIRRLGWSYVPALIIGTLDTVHRKGAVELLSIEDCQSYITDGEFVNDPHGCKVLNANWAQTEIYVRNREPYFDVD
jgi:hypothetical protein